MNKSLLFAFMVILMAAPSFAWYNASLLYRDNITIESFGASNGIIIPLQKNSSCFLGWAKMDVNAGNQTVWGYTNSDCNGYQFVNQTDNGGLQTYIEGNTGFPNSEAAAQNISADILWNSSYVYVFDFEQNSNTTMVNLKQAGPNVTTFGGARTTTDGIFGRGLEIDKGTANITNGWGPAYINDSFITFSFWMKAFDVGTYRHIFGMSDGVSCDNGFAITNLNKLRWLGGSPVDFQSIDALTANTTYYIVGIMDGARARMYINGINVNNATMSSSRFCLAPATLSFGGGISGGIANFYGILDDVEISNHNNMTDEQVKARYAASTRTTFGAQSIQDMGITITSPTNSSYINTNISLTTTSTIPADTWLYELNGAANVTFKQNTTFIVPYEGSNNIKVWANNTLGTFYNSSLVYFTVNTTPSMLFKTYDEITGKPQPFNLIMYLKGTNITSLQATAIRSSPYPCLYDGNKGTTCFESMISCGGGGGGSTSAQTWEVEGIDYNNATFLFKYDIIASGAGGGTVNVSYGSTTFLYDGYTVSGSNLTKTAIINVSNSNGDFPKAINFTINVTSTCDPSVQTETKIMEFDVISNSAGYTYYDNNTITIPSDRLLGYATYDLFFQGEETYNTAFSDKRMYIITIAPPINVNVNGYLLNHSLGYSQYFTILDVNNQPIENATMTLQRWYGGTKTTVAQCISNAAGSCLIFLQPNTEYALLISKTNYASKTSDSVIFTGAPNPANVYLSQMSTGNFTSVFNGIQVSLTPVNQYFSGIQNATCAVISTEGNIQYINLTVTQNINGSTEVSYNSSYISSNPSGTTLQVGINNNGRFTIKCNYRWISNASGTSQTYENTNTNTLWIYSDAIANQGQQMFDPGTGLIIAIGAILLIAGPISIFRPTYGAVIGMLLMLIFAFAGFIDWYIAALAILTTLSLVVLKSWI